MHRIGRLVARHTFLLRQNSGSTSFMLRTATNDNFRHSAQHQPVRRGAATLRHPLRDFSRDIKSHIKTRLRTSKSTRRITQTTRISCFNFYHRQVKGRHRTTLHNLRTHNTPISINSPTLNTISKGPIVSLMKLNNIRSSTKRRITRNTLRHRTSGSHRHTKYHRRTFSQRIRRMDRNHSSHSRRSRHTRRILRRPPNIPSPLRRRHTRRRNRNPHTRRPPTGLRPNNNRIRQRIINPQHQFRQIRTFIRRRSTRRHRSRRTRRRFPVTTITTSRTPRPRVSRSRSRHNRREVDNRR